VKMTQSSVQGLKSVQARIAQSQKMVALGRLAAGATHEINNPLTAVMGYAELLHEDSSLSPEEVRSANKIKEEVRRAQAAILSFRRVAASAEAETNRNALAERIE
jgi:two-component system, NtrC family, sensor kinase